eukprot:scaffold1513_cov100-Amphora_coffeaeformis.AAC.12
MSFVNNLANLGRPNSLDTLTVLQKDNRSKDKGAPRGNVLPFPKLSRFFQQIWKMGNMQIGSMVVDDGDEQT